jgi:hypothetical protein
MRKLAVLKYGKHTARPPTILSVAFKRLLIVCIHFALFQSLSAELAASKVDAQVTRNDLLHKQNVAQGRDKYKTLKQIRQGNTKQRVDMFEAM